MDLSTRFMGLKVKGPLIVGASPLADDLDTSRRLEDQGASALVTRSLFKEQILHEQIDTLNHIESWTDSFAEASHFLPEPVSWRHGPEEYLERLHRTKQALEIPVIGSLNGASPGDWTSYARLIEQAGADGLELNVYYLPLRGAETPQEVERRFLSVLTEVASQVDIPVSMKLNPFLTSPIYTAVRMAAAGASGFVLFNRLFPGQIDIEALEVHSDLRLSEPGMLRMRLMWVAAVYPHVDVPLCASGGVHTTEDVIRAIMAGADCVQLASVLLRNGPEHLGLLSGQLREWLETREYESLEQMRGSMSLGHAPDPEAYERANYMQTLQTWRPPGG